MPALLAAPWFIPLITGIGTAATVGTSAYQLSQGSGSNTNTLKAQQDALQKQQQQALLQQQRSAMLAQQGNTQAQTGGSLTPTGFLQQSAKTANVPSDLNSIAQYLGNGGSAATGPLSGGSVTPGAENENGGGLEQLSSLLKG